MPTSAALSFVAAYGGQKRNAPARRQGPHYVSYMGWDGAVPGDVLAIVSEAAALPGSCPPSPKQDALLYQSNRGFSWYCCHNGWIIAPPVPSTAAQQAITKQCDRYGGAHGTKALQRGGQGSTLSAGELAHWAALAAVGFGAILGDQGGTPRVPLNANPYKSILDAPYTPTQLRSWEQLNPYPARAWSATPPPLPESFQAYGDPGGCAAKGMTLGPEGMSACVNTALGLVNPKPSRIQIPEPSTTCDNGEDVIGCAGHFLHLPGGTLAKNPGILYAYGALHKCCPGSIDVYFTWAGSRSRVDCGRKLFGISCVVNGTLIKQTDTRDWTERQIVEWNIANCQIPIPPKIKPGYVTPADKLLLTVAARHGPPLPVVYIGPRPGGPPPPPPYTLPTPPPTPPPHSGGCLWAATCLNKKQCFYTPFTIAAFVEWQQANCIIGK